MSKEFYDGSYYLIIRDKDDPHKVKSLVRSRLEKVLHDIKAIELVKLLREFFKDYEKEESLNIFFNDKISIQKRGGEKVLILPVKKEEIFFFHECF